MSSTMTRDVAAPDSKWYVTAMEQLVGVVQDLSQARCVDSVAAIVRNAARRLTGADGATFVLRDKDQCYYADEDAIAPLWKGKRFPMSACVSGWVMNNARSVIIEDVYSDARVPTEAYRPTFVRSMAMVPIRRNAPIGAIGNYWASQRLASEPELAILQALADATSVALENVELDGQLREQVRVLHEHKARIQEQRDTLEVFTRALAHDLKEPVRTMRSFSRLALETDRRSDEGERYLQFVESAAQQMHLLVETALGYMQLDDPAGANAEPCAMAQVFDAARNNLAQLIQERGATIECSSLPVVRADRAHLIQVLQNLIVNAIHHNDRAVTVHVEATERPADWLITVRDNGVGIPPEHARRIFEPFKRLTTRRDSAGFGLAICEKIIARSGGAIWCEPNVGAGATLCFTLPRASNAPAVSPPAPLAPSAPREPASAIEAGDDWLARLLLVDDRPDDLTLSRIMLSRDAALQCRLLTAQSGEEALSILQREPIDLMLLDINMPGLDGFDVLERMRKDGGLDRTAVIMCTGSDLERDKQRARSLGAAGYLTKPPRFDALAELLKRVPTVRVTQQEDGRALRRIDVHEG